MRLKEILCEIVDIDWDSADQYPVEPPPKLAKDPQKGQLKGKAKKQALKNPPKSVPASGGFEKDEGNFARVMPVKNNPHLIRKEEKRYTDPNKNAYFQYVWTLKKHMASNPFVPRIYVAKEESDPKNPALKKFTYIMEKLIHPYEAASKTEGNSQFSHEALMGLGDRLIKNFDERLAQRLKRSQRTPQQIEPLELWQFIIGFIERAIENDAYGELADEQLIEACQIVLGAQYYTRKSGGVGGNDLHSDNIMVRLTSVGPQIVITDPIG